MDTIRKPLTVERAADRNIQGLGPKTPLVSLVLPVYNESAILEKTLNALIAYTKSLGPQYEWELIVIDDGSTDATGHIAEAFARQHSEVIVLHHHVNFGLGQALRYAFSRCRGDYVVTLDSDLSYAPEHIRSLLETISKTKSKVVIASPYMPRGKVSNVPWARKLLSLWANRFLSVTAKGSLCTLTGLVRAYDGRFLRSLNLKSLGMEINAEILYKAMLLGARVEEIPAHLIWPAQEGAPRRSSMRVYRHTMSMLLSGFLFRPMMFFIIPGLSLLVAAAYVNLRMAIHFLAQYQNLPDYALLDRASAASAAAYQQFPHTFMIGGLTLMLAIQLISLGILALQSKSYFEELFHLGTNIHKATQGARTAHDESCTTVRGR
jgi:glycosyltransferase involved in cell wall biosynthesis